VPLRFNTNVFRWRDIIVSMYVDDFMVLILTDSQINRVIRLLAKNLEVKDLGDMT